MASSKPDGVDIGQFFWMLIFLSLSAGQQQILQQLSPATVIPGVIHRPQVQQITNNVVTLSNVQSPAVYCTQSNHLLVKSTQPGQTFALPIKTSINNKGKRFRFAFISRALNFCQPANVNWNIHFFLICDFTQIRTQSNECWHSKQTTQQKEESLTQVCLH